MRKFAVKVFVRFWWNRLFVCSRCVYRCKGLYTLGRGYKATRRRSRNRIVCGGFISI